tara:strand:- start:21701 stop:21826 length:126 start_codon:yes stop_codon:yes gene_type:complete
MHPPSYFLTNLPIGFVVKNTTTGIYLNTRFQNNLNISLKPA